MLLVSVEEECASDFFLLSTFFGLWGELRAPLEVAEVVSFLLGRGETVLELAGPLH